MNPIDQLLEEHRDIMAEIIALRRAVKTLREQGDAALPASVPALRSVSRMMATRLLVHARKEDEALFPAVESALGAPGGPTSIMREEHRAIHERAGRFRETLRTLQELEHPAIVAGQVALHALAEGGGSATALADTGEEIVGLLDLHFAKEEEILFPMAREILTHEQLAEVAARMERIEADR